MLRLMAFLTSISLQLSGLVTMDRCISAILTDLVEKWVILKCNQLLLKKLQLKLL